MEKIRREGTDETVGVERRPHWKRGEEGRGKDEIAVERWKAKWGKERNRDERRRDETWKEKRQKESRQEKRRLGEIVRFSSLFFSLLHFYFYLLSSLSPLFLCPLLLPSPLFFCGVSSPLQLSHLFPPFLFLEMKWEEMWREVEDKRTMKG